VEVIEAADVFDRARSERPFFHAAKREARGETPVPATTDHSDAQTTLAKLTATRRAGLSCAEGQTYPDVIGLPPKGGSHAIRGPQPNDARLRAKKRRQAAGFGQRGRRLPGKAPNLVDQVRLVRKAIACSNRGAAFDTKRAEGPLKSHDPTKEAW
jgi:hypothetical protein